MNRVISVRKDRIYTWVRAEEIARDAEMSLSAYVAVALREKIARDTGEDTNAVEALRQAL